MTKISQTDAVSWKLQKHFKAGVIAEMLCIIDYSDSINYYNTLNYRKYCICSLHLQVAMKINLLLLVECFYIGKYWLLVYSKGKK